MRIRLLTRKLLRQLKCNHGGLVRPPDIDYQVHEEGSTFVTDHELLASKVDCPGPCKQINGIVEGRAKDLFTINGWIPMLRKFRVTTDGPGFVKLDDADLRALVRAEIIAMIRKVEGGYHETKYTTDKNGKQVVADPETNKGITVGVWNSTFPDAQHTEGVTDDRFMKMSDSDWGQVFDHQSWNPIATSGGSTVQDPAVLGMLVDWNLNGGLQLPSQMTTLQQTLDSDFGQSVTPTGKYGPSTIDAINGADPDALMDKLIQQRKEFYEGLHEKNPTKYPNLQGWLNRLKIVADMLTRVVNGTPA